MMRKIAIAALIALAVGPTLAQTPPAGTPRTAEEELCLPPVWFRLCRLRAF
jgi:hypothetical protein